MLTQVYWIHIEGQKTLHQKSRIKQDEAHLGKAQVKLEVKISVGVKVEFEIVVEVGAQLPAQVMGGGWVYYYIINAKHNSS